MIVIGCGTGRCGTVSLSTLLNSQDRFFIGHESIRMPWKFNKRFFEYAVSFFLDYYRKTKQLSVIGDV